MYVSYHTFFKFWLWLFNSVWYWKKRRSSILKKYSRTTSIYLLSLHERRTHELIWPQMKITYNKIEKTKAASFSCAINMFTKSCVKLHVVRSGTYGECGYRIRKLRVSTNCGLPTITEISQCRCNHQSQWNG